MRAYRAKRSFAKGDRQALCIQVHQQLFSVIPPELLQLLWQVLLNHHLPTTSKLLIAISISSGSIEVAIIAECGNSNLVLVSQQGVHKRLCSVACENDQAFPSTRLMRCAASKTWDTRSAAIHRVLLNSCIWIKLRMTAHQAMSFQHFQQDSMRPGGRAGGGGGRASQGIHQAACAQDSCQQHAHGPALCASGGQSHMLPARDHCLMHPAAQDSQCKIHPKKRTLVCSTLVRGAAPLTCSGAAPIPRSAIASCQAFQGATACAKDSFDSRCQCSGQSCLGWLS